MVKGLGFNAAICIEKSKLVGLDLLQLARMLS